MGRLSREDPNTTRGLRCWTDYRQVLDGQKVGVIHKRYPKINFTTKQLKAIQETIIEEILKVEEGSLQPKFLGTIFKTDYLVINCADEAMKEWLCNVVPRFKLWEDADLKVLRGENLPKAQIFNAFFPNSAEDNNEKNLRLIKVQNKGLCTNN